LSDVEPSVVEIDVRPVRVDALLSTEPCEESKADDRLESVPAGSIEECAYLAAAQLLRYPPGFDLDSLDLRCHVDRTGIDPEPEEIAESVEIVIDALRLSLTTPANPVGVDSFLWHVVRQKVPELGDEALGYLMEKPDRTRLERVSFLLLPAQPAINELVEAQRVQAIGELASSPLRYLSVRRSQRSPAASSILPDKVAPEEVTALVDPHLPPPSAVP
jgi:hypothetical protein